MWFMSRKEWRVGWWDIQWECSHTSLARQYEGITGIIPQPVSIFSSLPECQVGSWPLTQITSSHYESVKIWSHHTIQILNPCALCPCLRVAKSFKLCKTLTHKNYQKYPDSESRITHPQHVLPKQLLNWWAISLRESLS